MSVLTRDRIIEPAAEPRHRTWDAEDTAAWEAGDEKIAKRNLIWSTVAEHVGFSIWSIWSVMVLFMPRIVYGFTAGGKFYLLAAPTLVGGFMRHSVLAPGAVRRPQLDDLLRAGAADPDPADDVAA